MKNREYDVTIRETSERVVKVKAISAEEARAIVKGAWKNSEHVLDSDDFVDVAFDAQERRRERDHER